MKLEERHEEKIDPLLWDALWRAEEDEVLRVVMVLGPEPGDTEKGLGARELGPSEYASRVEYRQALIEQRRAWLSDRVGGTVRALRDLSLTSRKETLSRTVVVEGPASQILTSLDLPGVYHSSLDRPIELANPRCGGESDE